MIIVSSFRPHDDCPKANWEQQIAANRSWTKLFPQICYFNNRDQRMSSSKTMFLPTKGKPSIKTMATFCGKLTDWSAIVNADIVIPSNFRRVEDAMRGRPCACAISKRYTLPSDGDPAGAQMVAGDLGLDFFAATPEVWKKAGEAIPKEFTLGRIVWDNWILKFFMSEYGNYCHDLTPSRVIFHPQHEGRVDQNWEFPKDDPYLKKRDNWPFHVIEI